MTSSLILNLIVSVGIVLVILGMLVWVIKADRRAHVGPKSRATAARRAAAPAASLSGVMYMFVSFWHRDKIAFVSKCAGLSLLD